MREGQQPQSGQSTQRVFFLCALCGLCGCFPVGPRVTFGPMNARWILAVCTLAFSLPLAAASQQPPPPPQDKPQLPKSQMPDLGRPTRPNDEQPLFNLDRKSVV